MPSSLVFCRGGHRVLKPMHPTKFLGCNSWTLPFPIPAGGQGPAGLQSARSRAGPAGQSSGFWPLDLQRTLGCLGKPRGSDLSAKGWSGKGLEPRGVGVTKSQTQLSNFTFTFHFHAVEKEMATHSSALAWRIPWTEKPGRLQSMGSHTWSRT